ncbi:hypothetical protein WJX73_004005 [Symbiochloris irregularis]|uniref:Uncharacterized protein n=1 Tax=Symbiochloris irregularis TaxID=706552 RepID=A0AAW1P8U6_9CHLO
MAMEAEPNAYEQSRLDRIKQNFAKMRALGFDVSENLSARANVHEESILEASRTSKRIRGQSAPDAKAVSLAIETAASLPQEQTKSKPKLTLDQQQSITAPFTLRSIGTTVWDLGEVWRGCWSQNYWSSSGCLFHHAYPVGFKASKAMFGRTWEMRILAGDVRPSFEVEDSDGRHKFEGPSPTSPWTGVCLAQKTGQRISGPLYFGFSDLITQRAITSQYTERELQAAFQLTRLPSAAPQPEERAAAEFMTVEGLGAATATALALTLALGGQRHADLASLRTWAQADQGVGLALFLLTSLEMPESVRRWPAWRHRMVPKIVASICQGCEDIASLLPQQQQQQQSQGPNLTAEPPSRQPGDQGPTPSSSRAAGSSRQKNQAATAGLLAADCRPTGLMTD